MAYGIDAPGSIGTNIKGYVMSKNLLQIVGQTLE
ncbi:hypothetical protein SNOG_01188 [Parastagonospora nodorum SN15]|uniref:Uncharacterized protein n=1 Tax=Phaeosphaeria nodorum (strain SN15 / ATCC MYA-4574 / FGSC 10173) TaxID=321614 RepID=Q0V476_PHANO|nr:hypothetical protein SNOG_01188 [Parastagonospora nodorum SN15]EAT90837.1 hypothetical protein SNOG_01188 [Parastagonospora nodorum SN15]